MTTTAHPRPPQAPRAVSVDDAAYMLGVSRRTVYELIAEDRLRTIKIGKRRVVPVAAIDVLLAGDGEAA